MGTGKDTGFIFFKRLFDRWIIMPFQGPKSKERAAGFKELDSVPLGPSK
jgi:hypothetical protein